MSLLIEHLLTEATHDHFNLRGKLSERQDQRLEEFERKYDDLKLEYVLKIQELNKEYGVEDGTTRI